MSADARLMSVRQYEEYLQPLIRDAYWQWPPYCERWDDYAHECQAINRDRYRHRVYRLVLLARGHITKI